VKILVGLFLQQRGTQLYGLFVDGGIFLLSCLQGDFLQWMIYSDKGIGIYERNETWASTGFQNHVDVFYDKRQCELSGSGSRQGAGLWRSMEIKE